MLCAWIPSFRSSYSCRRRQGPDPVPWAKPQAHKCTVWRLSFAWLDPINLTSRFQPVSPSSILGKGQQHHLGSTPYGPVLVVDALYLSFHLTLTIILWIGVHCLRLTEEKKWGSRRLTVLLDVVGNIWTQLWLKPESIFFPLHQRGPCFLTRRTSSKDKHFSGSPMWYSCALSNLFKANIWKCYCKFNHFKLNACFIN